MTVKETVRWDQCTRLHRLYYGDPPLSEAELALRDFFAAQVLREHAYGRDATMVAKQAYKLADAMIEARKQGETRCT